MEKRIVQLRTHQKNISRYENMLKTELTDLERQFVQKRLSEERTVGARPCLRGISNLGVEAAVLPFSGGLNFLTLPKRPKERGTACAASPSISDQGSAFRAADCACDARYEASFQS